jgi:lipopolysaccharide export system permease protein
MRLIERYLFRQLLGPTLLATAALSGIALLSQSLSGLDILVDQRQSPLVFLKITLLAMPQLIVMILPVAVLVAALTVLNRMHTEQEIVTCFAAGMSRWRVLYPALQLSTWIALASLVMTLWIQPLCYRALRETLDHVRADLTATMLRPGQFTHPAAGLTVYAQSMEDDGTVHNLFIDRDDGHGKDSTITAQEGRLERRGQSPVLVMRHGANQEFSSTGVLNYISFDEYILDLESLVNSDRILRYKLSDRYPHELFFPDVRQPWDRSNRDKLLAEGHSRLSAPLYNIAFMIMAFASVIGGSFNKLGYATRMAAVAAAALILRTLGFAVQASAGGAPVLNVLQYLLPLAAAAVAGAILLSGRVGASDRSPGLWTVPPGGKPA